MWAVEHAPADRTSSCSRFACCAARTPARRSSSRDELFTDYEQMLFTKVVAIAERQGRPVKLLVLPATNIFDAVAQVAVRLRVSDIVVGQSANLSVDDQAQRMGEAWDRTPHDRDLATRFIFTSRTGPVQRVLARRACAGVCRRTTSITFTGCGSRLSKKSDRPFITATSWRPRSKA